MKTKRKRSPAPPMVRSRGAARARWSALGLAALAAGSSLALMGAQSTGAQDAQPAPTLEETRLTMGKWLETQQLLAKERKDWQQGKEILVGRLELVKKELGSLLEKLEQAQSSVAESEHKKEALLAERAQLEAADAQLVAAVGALESSVRKLYRQLPEPLQKKLQPLHQRMPEEGAKTRASAAERFQNVLGILNELNKANTEVTLQYEVRELADGRPAEVKSLYVGLAQAYYLSAKGEAGIGSPGPDGWTWRAQDEIAAEVATAQEILQGKHSPVFVPLPVTLR